MPDPISSRELAQRCSSEPDVWAEVARNPLAREIIQGDATDVDDWTMDEWYWYESENTRSYEDEFGEWSP